jgi:hypothetical protein
MKIGNIEGTKQEFIDIFKLLNIDENKYIRKKRIGIVNTFKKYIRNLINMIKYPENKIINSYIPYIDDNNKIYIIEDDKVEEFLELMNKPMITKEFYEKCKKANNKFKD